MPLILTHGWPGSVVEYLDLIGPLTDPRAHERDPSIAFDLVIPSLPGFAFSSPLTGRGWGTTRTAAAWVQLMRRLGYQRYGAAGNDAGSMVSPEVGRLDPDHVTGVHVTQVFSFPSGDPGEFEGLSGQDMAALAKLQWFMDHKFSFNQLQSQQPQTLAHALADSPAGLLAWNGQLMGEDAMGEKGLDDDFILTNVALYWLTNTGGSSIRFYHEDAGAPRPQEPTTVRSAWPASPATSPASGASPSGITRTWCSGPCTPSPAATTPPTWSPTCWPTTSAPSTPGAAELSCERG